MRRTLKLALPVAFTYLGIMLMPTVDLIMVGHLGASAVGGLGLGGALFAWVMVTGLGFLYGMDFPASHAIGEGKPENAYRTFVQGLYLSLICAVPGTLIVLFTSMNIEAFGFNSEVAPFARSFLNITAVSLIFVFVFNACRGYLQAASIAIPTLLVLIAANLLNYFLNVALIFGRFGFPELGFQGSPTATLISRFFMAATLFVIVVVRDRRGPNYIRHLGFEFDRAIFKLIARLGFPSAIQMLFEVGVFALATAMTAKFTADALAAHQMVLNSASMTFIVPMGISSATSVLVGQAMGARDFKLARLSGYQSWWIVLVFMGTTASCMLLFPEKILSVYSASGEVQNIAYSLLWLAGLFQLTDGTQALMTGALRGLGNTRTAAITNLIGHWAVGFPLSYYFAFIAGKGVFGIWIGLSSGLAFVAIVLTYFWNKESKDFEKLARVSNATDRAVGH